MSLLGRRRAAPIQPDVEPVGTRIGEYEGEPDHRFVPFGGGLIISNPTFGNVLFRVLHAEDEHGVTTMDGEPGVRVLVTSEPPGLVTLGAEDNILHLEAQPDCQQIDVTLPTGSVALTAANIFRRPHTLVEEGRTPNELVQGILGHHTKASRVGEQGNYWMGHPSTAALAIPITPAFGVSPDQQA